MSAREPAASRSANEEYFIESGGATSLELFFDLVFVFAFTQVTSFLSNHLTWLGMLQGIGLLAVLWWAWVGYSWLTNAVPAEEALSARLVILFAMAAMLIVSLAVPDAFGEHGVYFGVAYFVVRFLQVALYTLATRRTPETRLAILRLAPGFLGGPALLIVAGFLDGLVQGVLWTLALTIDYGVPLVRGVVGFHIRAKHFVERHGEIIMIALGESIVAISAAGLKPDAGTVLTAIFAFALSAALWWAYFDVVVLVAERRLASARGEEQVRLARDSYSYLHLPMVAGIILVALGLKKVLADVGDPLGMISATALCGGVALYLLGHNAFRLRDTGSVSLPRLVVAALCCVLILVAVQVPALVALAIIAMLLCALVTFEAVRSSELRRQLRTL